MGISTKIRTAIIEDNVGTQSQFSCLFTEQGNITTLTDYLLYAEQQGRSKSWMDKVIRATQLLLEYMEANKNTFTDPQALFITFTKRLYTGTIGDDGLDPSGLYWMPASTSTASQWINALTAFFDWLSQQQHTEPINPMVEATTHQQRLNYAAWFHKNQHNFLGHIKNKNISSTLRKARLIQGRTPVSRTNDDAIAFNSEDFPRFFNEGIGKRRDIRAALRDRLIVLLMHGGGLRVSEALHLWVTDVFEDPLAPERALVRIYHPEDGKAPEQWQGRHGETYRAAYLKENYALVPRNRLQTSQRLGWKNRVMDHQDNFIQVQWFPLDYGRLFMKLWQDYLYYLSAASRDHPYAFIVFRGETRWQPYTQVSFNNNYQKGLRRIGLEPNKSLGYDPHGHRHSYGRRLQKAGVDSVIIKKCLHHASVASQEVYTGLSLEEVSSQLTEVATRLAEANNQTSDKTVRTWNALIENDFNDIDPDGLFTGASPVLR